MSQASNPKKLSPGEEAFALHCRAEDLSPVREYRFVPARMFRFDFAFVADKLAVEIEGGVWTGGRHLRGQGFESDCIKYNWATRLGWRVLRYSTAQVIQGDAIRDTLEVLKCSPR
jgi:very-short-patch-repair endonuclease